MLKDAWTQIADRYNDIIRRSYSEGRPTPLSSVERMIFYIVSTRCEIDINGFPSVFEQLLNAADIRFLVKVLTDLGEDELAECFQEALITLEAVGFKLGNDRIAEYPSELDSQIESIGRRVQQDERLWDLDPKLCHLFTLSEQGGQPEQVI